MSSSDTKSFSSLTALTRGDAPLEAPPSYAESSSSSSAAAPSPPPPIESETPAPQKYASLLPPGDPSPGPPPNYESATSSLPDDRPIKPRAESPEPKARGWTSHLHLHRGGGEKAPPAPEGVPLEEVCDRFGNRKRELKLRSQSERMKDPVSAKTALKRVPIGFWM